MYLSTSGWGCEVDGDEQKDGPIVEQIYIPIQSYNFNIMWTNDLIGWALLLFSSS